MDSAFLAHVDRRAKALRSMPDPPVRKAIREAVHVSQSEIARALGVSPQAVQMWEAGARTPRGDNLFAYVTVIEELRRRAPDVAVERSEQVAGRAA